MDNKKDKKSKPLKLSSSGRLQIRKNLGPSAERQKAGNNNKTIQMRSSSGCSFKCSFCTYPVSSKGFHPAEMDYLKAQLDIIGKMKIENLIFIDDTPNFPTNRFIAMLKLLKEYIFDGTLL